MPAGLLQLLLGGYAALGVLAAGAFVVFGLVRIDGSVRGASFGFKALIFPGLVALWPLFVARWLRGSGHPPEERTAHRERAVPIAPAKMR